MKSNYEVMAENAARLFAQKDMRAIAAKWDLPMEDGALNFRFMSDPVKINMENGKLEAPDRPYYHSADGFMTDEAMIIYDMFGHEGESRPKLSGNWASISTIGGIIGIRHSQSLNRSQFAASFAGHPEKLLEALRRAGGREVAGSELAGSASSHADLTVQIPVFDFFPVRMEFWDADEDFPADIHYLWDADSLKFLKYETLWYVMKAVEKRVEWEAENEAPQG